jgi:hypothetical protein
VIWVKAEVKSVQERLELPGSGLCERRSSRMEARDLVTILVVKVTQKCEYGN